MTRLMFALLAVLATQATHAEPGTAPMVLAPAARGTNFVDFYHGQLPEVAMAGGGRQSGLPGTTLSEPVSVTVGGGLQNAPVTFTVTSGEAKLSASAGEEGTLATTVDARAVTLVPGSDGNYVARAYVHLPDTKENVSTITATARSGEQSKEVNTTASVSERAEKPTLELSLGKNTATTIDAEWIPTDLTRSTVIEVSYDKGGTWKEAGTFPPGQTSGTVRHLLPDHRIYSRARMADKDDDKPK